MARPTKQAAADFRSAASYLEGRVKSTDPLLESMDWAFYFALGGLSCMATAMGQIYDKLEDIERQLEGAGNPSHRRPSM